MNKDITFLPADSLQQLIDAVKNDGYECIGPQVKDGTIIYAHLENPTQLPYGYTQQQSAGISQLSNTDSKQYFSWANGPQAIKPVLFAPRQPLWQSQKNESGNITFIDCTEQQQNKKALFAVRACDIAAMHIQDKHFLQQTFTDPSYKQRRQDILIIAVNCTHPAESCFCASTGDGPYAQSGYDIALTEIDNGFLIEAHSQVGKNISQSLNLSPATERQQQQSREQEKQSIQKQRRLPDTDIKQRLQDQQQHALWDSIAERCLSCGNCTSVCPTCFCHSEYDDVSLDGDTATHYRQWDSCFTQGHSYIHGITIRSTTTQRYRQWLTHKFSSWHEQYGRSGCTGCGRCIAWCPVGIDVIDELTSICEPVL